MVAIITFSTTHTYIMASANTRAFSQLMAQLCSSSFLFFSLYFPFLLPPPPTPTSRPPPVTAGGSGDEEGRNQKPRQPLHVPPGMSKPLLLYQCGELGSKEAAGVESTQSFGFIQLLILQTLWPFLSLWIGRQTGYQAVLAHGWCEIQRCSRENRDLPFY